MKRKSTTDAAAGSRIPGAHIVASVGVHVSKSNSMMKVISKISRDGSLSQVTGYVVDNRSSIPDRTLKNKQYTRTDLRYSFLVALRRSLLLRLTPWSAYSEDNVIALCSSHCIPSCMLTSVRIAQCSFLDS